MTDKSESSYEDAINLKPLFFYIRSKLSYIALITALVTILGVLVSLALPNIYESKTLLTPSNQSESMSSMLGSYSSLAGIAGIDLPESSANKSTEAIARINSFDFFAENFLPQIKLEDLLAVKSWKSDTNEILYNDKLFDSNNNKWVRDAKPPKSVMPSDQEAYERYKKILSLSENRKTGYVSISIKHQSPYLAKDWLDIIIKNINETMRDLDKSSAASAIQFLNKEAESIKFTELKDVISNLLESQMQTFMLASVNENYVFKVISTPLVSELKISPNRFFIFCLSVFLGLMIGFFTFTLSYLFKGIPN
jgi:LPS O-antigen subunit length determinant protein (WzzB/FepE family)